MSTRKSFYTTVWLSFDAIWFILKIKMYSFSIQSHDDFHRIQKNKKSKFFFHTSYKLFSSLSYVTQHYILPFKKKKKLEMKNHKHHKMRLRIIPSKSILHSNLTSFTNTHVYNVPYQIVTIQAYEAYTLHKKTMIFPK